MIWAWSGISAAREPRRAAREAAPAASADLAGAGPAFMFSTADHSGDDASMLQTVRESAGTGKFVGCSGAGLLTGEAEIEGDRGVAVMALAAERATAVPIMVRNLDRRDREAGREIGREIGRLVEPCMAGGSLPALVPATLSCNPGALFIGIEETIGPIPVAGGRRTEADGQDPSDMRRPIAAFFSLCEFAPVAGLSRLHNDGAVMTILSEENGEMGSERVR